MLTNFDKLITRTMDKIDLNTFQQEKDNYCECNQNYMECAAMKRLFAGLKYYSMLNIIGNKNDREVWNKFIHEIYDNLIFILIIIIHMN